jgi:hypothetical protein
MAAPFGVWPFLFAHNVSQIEKGNMKNLGNVYPGVCRVRNQYVARIMRDGVRITSHGFDYAVEAHAWRQRELERRKHVSPRSQKTQVTV